MNISRLKITMFLAMNKRDSGNSCMFKTSKREI